MFKTIIWHLLLATGLLLPVAYSQDTSFELPPSFGSDSGGLSDNYALPKEYIDLNESDRFLLRDYGSYGNQRPAPNPEVDQKD